MDAAISLVRVNGVFSRLTFQNVITIVRTFAYYCCCYYHIRLSKWLRSTTYTQVISQPLTLQHFSLGFVQKGRSTWIQPFLSNFLYDRGLLLVKVSGSDLHRAKKKNNNAARVVHLGNELYSHLFQSTQVNLMGTWPKRYEKEMGSTWMLWKVSPPNLLYFT